METQQIHGKMAQILAEMDAIGKDKKNESQNFKYRGIDDVYNAINPLLAKHGVFMTAQVLRKDRQERVTAKGGVLAFTSLHMRYRFYASDGSFVETEAEGEGMDSGDKSSNKAMAVAHKYALLQAFCVPTKDLDDPDAHAHEVAPMRPEGVSEPPKADRKAAANKWGNEQVEKLKAFTKAEEFYAWHERYATAVGAVRDFNEALHKRLTTEILACQGRFNPMAAE